LSSFRYSSELRSLIWKYPALLQTQTSIFFLGAKTKLNSVAFSPHANYTDRATAACRRS
jgi:hypothetical protein